MALLVSCVMLASAAPAKVAVYVEGNISSADKSAVSSAALSRMSGSKDFEAYERNSSFISSLDKEQDFQTSGEVPDSEIRKIGARCGVDYVVVMDVTNGCDGKISISARLINVETFKIEKSVSLSRDYTDSSVLTSLAKNVVYRLINRKSK